MYDPRTLSDPVSPRGVEHAGLARNHQLVIYAGSGVSRSDPAALPMGADLAALAFAHLSSLLGGMPPCDQHDLRSIADAVAGLPAGSGALKHALVAIAEFTTASPNYAHRVLALLILESFVSVLTTNWDTCIERAGQPELVPVIISDIDRQDISGPALLKLHGSAHRPGSMLVTSAELTSPPPWVQPEVAGRLSRSVVVFAGVGDIPLHIRDSIDRVVRAVGNSNLVHVVAPDISSGWAGSAWSAIVPDLPVDHRIALSADAFLDDLARAIVNQGLLAFREVYKDDPRLLRAWDSACHALSTFTAVAALRWFRDAAIGLPAGVSVLGCREAAMVLVALGLLGEQSVELTESGGATVNGEDRYSVLIATQLQTMTRVRREAQSRLQRRLEREGPGGTVKFLVANPGVRVSRASAVDVVASGGTDDLVDGPLSSTVVIIDAGQVLGHE